MDGASRTFCLLVYVNLEVRPRARRCARAARACSYQHEQHTQHQQRAQTRNTSNRVSIFIRLAQQVVQLRHLGSRTELNGCRALCERYDPATGRLGVRLEGVEHTGKHGVKGVKLANVAIVARNKARRWTCGEGATRRAQLELASLGRPLPDREQAPWPPSRALPALFFSLSKSAERATESVTLREVVTAG